MFNVNLLTVICLDPSICILTRTPNTNTTYTFTPRIQKRNKHNSKEDSYTIFRDAAALNMTESGYVWIVTEQALNANNTPDGVIGLQLVHAKSEKNHIRVSIIIIYANKINI